MRATTLVLLLSLFFFLAVSSHANVVSNGYFNGRSAKHVVAPKNVENLKSDSFLVLKSTNAYKASTIKDTDVADLLSHIMSTGALNGVSGDHDRSAYPAVDVFAPAQANLFVTVDYLGAESAQSELKSVGQSIEVTKTSYPMSPISFLTTLATGTTPAVHGIVSSFWKEFDDVYTAYSSEGQSMIGNFADFLSQNTQGKSAVISISADEQQSIALCSHQLNVAREPLSNNFCYTWDSTSNNVKSISSPSEKLSLLTRQQIWLALTQKDSTLNKILASAGISVVVAGDVTRSRLSLVSNGVASEFELSTQEDVAFSAEISMVADLIARLRLGAYNSLIQDSAQDHFSVAISTLRTVAVKYGEDSTHFAVAVKAVDAVIKTLIQEIEKAYNNKVITEVVFMGKQTLELPSSLKTIVEAHYLPQIVPFSTKTEEEAVQAVEKALENTQFEVVEQDVSEITYFRAKRAAESSSPIDLLTITPSQLASFQICLWIPILLTIIVLAITITMISMGSSATSGKEANVFNAPRSGAAQ